MVVLLAAALAVGVLIGTVGVGGVLLAPALILVGGMDPHQATATTLCCVVPAGIASFLAHRPAALRRGSIDRQLAPGLLVGAVAGAWLSGYVPDQALTALIAAVAGASGLWLLTHPATYDGQPRRVTLRTGTGPAIGTVVGCGSALSGTSGPALLVPTLIAARVPTDRAVTVSQASQAVVAPAGAITYLSVVELDLVLLAGLAVAVTLGHVVGTRAARLLRGTGQHTLVGLVLLGTGVLMVVRQLQP